MAQMSEFKWNGTPKQIENNLGINNALQKYTAMESARLMDKYVPFDTGALSQNITLGVDNLGGYVKYNVPYAHRIYTGNFNFNKEKHILATNYWDKAMLTAEGDSLRRAVSNYRVRLAR